MEYILIILLGLNIIQFNQNEQLKYDNFWRRIDLVNRDLQIVDLTFKVKSLEKELERKNVTENQFIKDAIAAKEEFKKKHESLWKQTAREYKKEIETFAKPKEMHYYQKCHNTGKIILEWEHELRIGDFMCESKIKRYADPNKRIGFWSGLTCPYCGKSDCWQSIDDYIATTNVLMD